MATKLFICHAGEDKDAVARPLAQKLRDRGFDVWYDEYEINVGDSLRAAMDGGLRGCDYGILVISEAFIGKRWPEAELDGLLALEERGHKVVLPVWHGLNRSEVAAAYPMLAGRAAAETVKGLDHVVDSIVRAVDASLSAADRRLIEAATESESVALVVRMNGSDICKALTVFYAKHHGLQPAHLVETRVVLTPDCETVNEAASFTRTRRGQRIEFERGSIHRVIQALCSDLSATHQYGGWAVTEKNPEFCRAEVAAVFFRKRTSPLDEESFVKYCSAVLAFGCRSYSTHLDYWCFGTRYGDRLVADACAQLAGDEIVRSLKRILPSSGKMAGILVHQVRHALLAGTIRDAHPVAAFLVEPSSSLTESQKDEVHVYSLRLPVGAR